VYWNLYQVFSKKIIVQLEEQLAEEKGRVDLVSLQAFIFSLPEFARLPVFISLEHPRFALHPYLVLGSKL
jgi:hypothetical protein